MSWSASGLRVTVVEVFLYGGVVDVAQLNGDLAEHSGVPAFLYSKYVVHLVLLHGPDLHEKLPDSVLHENTSAPWYTTDFGAVVPCAVFRAVHGCCLNDRHNRGGRVVVRRARNPLGRDAARKRA